MILASFVANSALCSLVTQQSSKEAKIIVGAEILVSVSMYGK